LPPDDEQPAAFMPAGMVFEVPPTLLALAYEVIE
jgi:hypothetical protein